MKVFKYSLVFFLSILSSLSGQTSQNVNLIGRWGHGSCQAVYADSIHAFIGNGVSFQILDMTDPESPQVLGEVVLPEAIKKIIIRDNFAYVLTGQSGVRVVDISNYYTPTEITFYKLQTYIEDLAIGGNCAYVTAGDSGLRIIDISNPLSINEISDIYPSGRARFVDVDENFAYVSIEWSLRVIDISDPYNPSEVGHIDTWAYRMDISGDYAYVTSGSFSDLHIIDISDPSNPNQISSVNTPSWANNVTVHGQYAYIANGDSGIRVINISDPKIPKP